MQQLSRRRAHWPGCAGRMWKPLGLFTQDDGTGSSQENAYSHVRLKKPILLPSSIPHLPKGRRSGKWDVWVDQRCSGIRAEKLTTNWAAVQEFQRRLEDDRADHYRGSTDVDEYGTGLKDHVCFFHVIATLLQRLDQRILSLIFNACCEKWTTTMEQIGYSTAMNKLLMGSTDPREYYDASYRSLLRAYPEETDLNHPARGRSAHLTRDKKLTMSKRLLEILESFSQTHLCPGEMPTDDPDWIPENARVCKLRVEQEPEVAEFVRELVFLAEDGILRSSVRKDVVTGVRRVVDEWLDYLWMPEGSLQWTEMSDLSSDFFCDPGVDDIYPFKDPRRWPDCGERLQRAKDCLDRADKVARAGGLAKWGLLDLYHFEVGHAKRLVEGAEEKLKNLA